MTKNEIQNLCNIRNICVEKRMFTLHGRVRGDVTFNNEKEGRKQLEQMMNRETPINPFEAVFLGLLNAIGTVIPQDYIKAHAYFKISRMCGIGSDAEVYNFVGEIADFIEKFCLDAKGLRDSQLYSENILSKRKGLKCG